MLLPLQGPPLDAMQERAARSSRPHLPTQGRGLPTTVSRPSPLVSAMLVQELLGEASALGSLLEEVVGREASFLGRRSRLASSHRVTRTRTTGSSGLLQRARVPHLRAGLEAAAAPPRHPLQPHPAAVRRLCRAAGDPTTTTTTTAATTTTTTTTATTTTAAAATATTTAAKEHVDDVRPHAATANNRLAVMLYAPWTRPARVAHLRACVHACV